VFEFDKATTHATHDMSLPPRGRSMHTHRKSSFLEFFGAAMHELLAAPGCIELCACSLHEDHVDAGEIASNPLRKSELE
jgi:hypothetical protein